ncbi:MAG: hypothetical protein BWY47_02042 [Bacteroidetes bacterium ADurb.Bin302]|nr:MAG: hypothetical protein BWY47_02042 [Bacteroidetes bacterium ADurb.Bin302]
MMFFIVKRERLNSNSSDSVKKVPSIFMRLR